VLPRDIKLAFPYLGENELPLLTFSHLLKAKRYWKELFEERLKGCLYSSSQLAIWFLFQRLVDSDEEKRSLILAQSSAQRIVGSDPIFFEKVVQMLQPDGGTTSQILQKIFKDQILHPEVASQINEMQIGSILTALAQGASMVSAIRRELETDSSLDEIELPAYERFCKTGKLRIHSVEEWFGYYKRSIDEGDMPLAEWFQGYIAADMEVFVDHPRFPEMLEELSALKSKSLLNSIDKHLEKNGLFPSFDSDHFEQMYLFAVKHPLRMYAEALRAHFESSLSNFVFSNESSLIARDVKFFHERIISLFADHQEPLLKILKDKISSFLENSPPQIEEVADAAREYHHAWLLEQVYAVYCTNIPLFSRYWLSPLKEVLIEEP
jgi:hypothetical protein